MMISSPSNWRTPRPAGLPLVDHLDAAGASDRLSVGQPSQGDGRGVLDLDPPLSGRRIVVDVVVVRHEESEAPAHEVDMDGAQQQVLIERRPSLERLSPDGQPRSGFVR
jgi:hypothetical protein